MLPVFVFLCFYACFFPVVISASLLPCWLSVVRYPLYPRHHPPFRVLFLTVKIVVGLFHLFLRVLVPVFFLLYCISFVLFLFSELSFCFCLHLFVFFAVSDPWISDYFCDDNIVVHSNINTPTVSGR